MSSRPPEPAPEGAPTDGRPLAPRAAGDSLRESPTLGDVMQLPDAMRLLVLWLLRHGEAGLPELTAAVRLEEGPCRDLLETLVGRGFLQGDGGDGARRYRTRLAPRRPRAQSSDIWERLKG